MREKVLEKEHMGEVGGNDAGDGEYGFYVGVQMRSGRMMNARKARLEGGWMWMKELKVDGMEEVG